MDTRTAMSCSQFCHFHTSDIWYRSILWGSDAYMCARGDRKDGRGKYKEYYGRPELVNKWVSAYWHNLVAQYGEIEAARKVLLGHRQDMYLARTKESAAPASPGYVGDDVATQVVGLLGLQFLFAKAKRYYRLVPPKVPFMKGKLRGTLGEVLPINQEICTACSGAGSIPTYEPCSNCGGSGAADYEKYKYPCPSCGATGRGTMTTSLCPSCSGSGWYQSEEHLAYTCYASPEEMVAGYRVPGSASDDSRVAVFEGEFMGYNLTMRLVVAPIGLLDWTTLGDVRAFVQQEKDEESGPL